MPNNNIVGTGSNSGRQLQVDPTHLAIRTSVRPAEQGLFGSYRKTLKSGVVAAGMTGPLPVWEMRWGVTGMIAVVRSLRIQATVSTTAFSATAADSSFLLYRSTGFTAMDTTSGTLGSFASVKANAMYSQQQASQFAGDATATRTGNGGIVILNTANTGLTGGTKTNDTDPIAIVNNGTLASAAWNTSITPGPVAYMIDPAKTPGLDPLMLQVNEGLVLVIDAIAATGTWRVVVDVEWSEYGTTAYFS